MLATVGRDDDEGASNQLPHICAAYLAQLVRGHGTSTDTTDWPWLPNVVFGVTLKIAAMACHDLIREEVSQRGLRWASVEP